MSLLGAGVLWIRFDASELPAGEALAKFPRADLIATGAVDLALFLAFGLLAVLLVYLLQSMLKAQRDSRGRADHLQEVEDQLSRARDRLAGIEPDVAPAAGTTSAAATTLSQLREKARTQVRKLEEKLIAIEVESRRAEDAARGKPTLTLANQLGLLIIVAVEVTVVIWSSHSGVGKKVLFTAVMIVATGGYVLLGEVTKAGKANPTTLVVRREDGGVVLALQILAVILPLVGIGLLIDKWLAIPIVVALALAGVNLAIGRMHPRRFFWYGCSIFASVALFGAVLTYSRTQRDPTMQPAAAALNSGAVVSGLFVTETSDRLYLAATEVKPHSIFWLSLKDIRTIAIGPLRPLKDANQESKVLAEALRKVP